MAKKDTLIMGRLIEEHEDLLKKIEELASYIDNLQYEGKLYEGRNIKSIEELFHYFQTRLISHVKLDEEVIFPFTKTHIPKLEAMVDFLSGEHKELKDAFKAFNKSLEQLKKAKTNKSDNIDKLKNKGTYLVCMIRNHIQTENESVYRVLSKQLKAKEKEKLRGAIAASG